VKKEYEYYDRLFNNVVLASPLAIKPPSASDAEEKEMEEEGVGVEAAKEEDSSDGGEDNITTLKTKQGRNHKTEESMFWCCV
jgi:hypothetical protein